MKYESELQSVHLTLDQGVHRFNNQKVHGTQINIWVSTWYANKYLGQVKRRNNYIFISGITRNYVHQS